MLIPVRFYFTVSLLDQPNVFFCDSGSAKRALDQEGVNSFRFLA